MDSNFVVLELSRRCRPSSHASKWFICWRPALLIRAWRQDDRPGGVGCRLAECSRGDRSQLRLIADLKCITKLNICHFSIRGCHTRKMTKKRNLRLPGGATGKAASPSAVTGVIFQEGASHTSFFLVPLFFT